MLLALPTLLAACASPGAPEAVSSVDSGALTASIADLTVTVDPLLPTIVHVTWSAPGDGPAFVEWGEGSAFDHVAPAAWEGEHWAATVIGMPAGAGVQLRPVTLDGDTRIEAPVPHALWVQTPPDSLGRLHVTLVDPRSEVADGWVLLHPMAEGRGGVGLVEAATGRWVWWRTVDDPADGVVRARPWAHGIHWMTNRWGRTADTATVHRLGLDGAHAGTVRTPLAHHDFLVDGDTTAWIGFALHPEVWVEGDPIPDFAEDRLFVQRGDSAEAIWSALDGLACEPVWRPTMERGDFLPEASEWTHANSLLRVDDRWFLLLRYEDALVALDDDGAVEWVLGGRCSDLGFADDDGWSWPHLSDAWMAADGLHLLVFDNGTHHDPPVTAAREFVVDEALGVARSLWRVPHPGGAYLHVQGDVRRLPRGNRLIAWSPTGVVEEVTPAGEVVWRAETVPTFPLGRVHFVEAPQRVERRRRSGVDGWAEASGGTGGRWTVDGEGDPAPEMGSDAGDAAGGES